MFHSLSLFSSNPLNPIKLTMVSPSAGNRQLATDCSPNNPMLISDRCKLTAWDGLYHDFWERFIHTKKVEKPDVVMAIHPRLEGEFWGPTVDMLLDENIKVVFTCFNKDHYEESLGKNLTFSLPNWSKAFFSSRVKFVQLKCSA